MLWSELILKLSSTYSNEYCPISHGMLTFFLKRVGGGGGGIGKGMVQFLQWNLSPILFSNPCRFSGSSSWLFLYLFVYLFLFY